MIKKLLSIFVVVMLFNNLNAQTLTNGDFELWDNINTPKTWQTWYTLAPGLVDGCFQVDTTFTSGQYSMALETKDYFAVGSLTGVALIGTMELDTDLIITSVPYDFRPTELSGDVMYFPVNGDTMAIQAIFTKWNNTTNKRDTLGYSIYATSDSITQWTNFSVPIYWSSFENPDSMLFVAISTVSDSAQWYIGSKAYMDNLSFGSFITGEKKESLFAGVDTKLGPNPVKAELNFYTSDKNIGGTVKFYDVTGRFAKEVEIESYHQTINVKDLQEGLYVYDVRNANGEQVKNGKINIIE